MKPPRIYLDTSIFGGCFDRQFERDSKRLIALVSEGRIDALVSALVADELQAAPPRVRELFDSLSPSSLTRVAMTSDTGALASAYLEAGIVQDKSRADASHVASASAARADAIASWNFKDIARFDRIRGFNIVNRTLGYDFLTIVSPQGIHFDELL